MSGMTPGQAVFEAWRGNDVASALVPPWAGMGAGDRARWERASQAVLDQAATAERNKAYTELDDLREQLGVLQDRIGNLAAGLKLSAGSSRPSKKSEIEDGCAAALLQLLDPR